MKTHVLSIVVVAVLLPLAAVAQDDQAANAKRIQEIRAKRERGESLSADERAFVQKMSAKRRDMQQDADSGRSKAPGADPVIPSKVSTPAVPSPGQADEEQFADGSTGRLTEFRGVGGLAIPAYIRKPRGPGPFPVVVLMHGGRYGKAATVGTGRSMQSPVADFIQAGWAVYAADYRPEEKIAIVPIEVDDTVEAVKAARGMAGIDRGRVGLMGGSHGGQVLSRVVSRVDTRGAILCAPAAMDLIEVKRAVVERKEKLVPILMKLVSDMERKYGASAEEIAKDPAKFAYGSALTEVAQVRCPILIINGRNDDNSPASIIEIYVNKLRAAGKQVETYLPDNGPHGFYFGHPDLPETKEAARLAVEFFRKQFAPDRNVSITSPKTTPYTGPPIAYRYPPHDQWNTPSDAIMSFVDPIKEAPHGTTYKTFHSKTIDGDVSYLVALPPGYEKEQTTRYPVLYYLGASGATPKREASGVQPYIAKAISSKAALPLLVVYCPGLCGNTMYCDSRDGKYPLETVITMDLIPHVDATYRTIPLRAARGVEGFSMGGFGAAHLGMKFPELFGVISIKAPPLLEPDSRWRQVRQAWGNLFPTAMANDLEYFKANDPFQLAVQNAGKLRDHTCIRLTTHILSGENWIQARVEALHQQLLKNHIPHEYHVYESVKTHSPVGVFACQGDSAFDFFNSISPELRNRSSTHLRSVP